MTASSLKTRITEDMKSAMRAKDTLRLGTIRLLLAAMKQREVDERIELDDVAISGIIEKLIKQRRDSISQFQTAVARIWSITNRRSWRFCRLIYPSPCLPLKSMQP